MSFEVNRYKTIQKARDTGQAQLTGPIILVQDSRKTPGFLFYTPFYRHGLKYKTKKSRQENILGVTYAPFIMTKLMHGTLSSKNRHIGIAISDGKSQLYSDSKNANEPNAKYTKNISVKIYGRYWHFNSWPNSIFESTWSNNQPALILFGGLIINIFLLLLFLFSSKASQKALTYADKITTRLEKNQ